MKINDILECFNVALDAKGNPNRIHYVARSTWEKRIGAVKSSTTFITLVDPQAEPKDIISEEYIDSVPAGQEEILMEESQKKALIEFIKMWDNDTRVK